MRAAAAIEDRIRRHHAALVRFLARRAPQVAEELAQETWLRIARRAPDCPTDDAFRAYAFTVARRLLVDHHRRTAARVTLVALEGELTHPASDAPPDALLDAAETLAVVQATLDLMKPELAEVFRWRTAEAVPFKEIARRQETSINTALGRMHQAVKKVHAALDAAHRLPPEETPDAL